MPAIWSQPWLMVLPVACWGEHELCVWEIIRRQLPTTQHIPKQQLGLFLRGQDIINVFSISFQGNKFI